MRNRGRTRAHDGFEGGSAAQASEIEPAGGAATQESGSVRYRRAPPSGRMDGQQQRNKQADTLSVRNQNCLLFLSLRLCGTRTRPSGNQTMWQWQARQCRAVRQTQQLELASLAPLVLFATDNNSNGLQFAGGLEQRRLGLDDVQVELGIGAE